MGLFGRAKVKGFQVRDSFRLLKKRSRILIRLNYQIEKVGRKLQSSKYTPEYVARLERRYIHRKRGQPNPEKFRQKMDDLCKRFFRLLYEFVNLNNQIFRIFDEIAIQASKEEYIDLQEVTSLLAEANKKAGAGYFGHDTLEEFQHSFGHFVEMAVAQAQRSYVNARRVKHGKQPRKGFMKRFKSTVALARQIRRITRTKIVANHRRMRLIKDDLHAELAKQKIHQAFLPVLDEYFSGEGRIVLLMATLKIDLAELILKHIREVNQVVKHVFRFERQASQSYNFSSKEKEMLQHVFSSDELSGREAEKFANDEYKDDRALYGEIRSIATLSKILLKRLSSAAAAVEHEEAKIAA